jgi:hypothetical protein
MNGELNVDVENKYFQVPIQPKTVRYLAMERIAIIQSEVSRGSLPHFTLDLDKPYPWDAEKKQYEKFLRSTDLDKYRDVISLILSYQ